MKIDIIIPTYKPDEKLIQLLKMLEKQTIPVNRIILMNTEQRYLEAFVYGSRFFEEHRQVEVYHHSKKEFDHGKTRNSGIRKSKTDVFVCMTQDAVPEDVYLLEKLLVALQEESVAVAYARQLPDVNCSLIETFTRLYNYPDQSLIKSVADLPQMGIKTFFCSNVCAAYRRDIFENLGGFISHTIFNEDMIYASKAIKAGYRIAYAAEAKVIHSHDYSNCEQFHRNFDLGVSHADHPDVFLGIPTEKEGWKLVKRTRDYLIKHNERKMIIPLFLKSAYKFIGYQMGKRYKKLPSNIVKKCSMNKNYWK